MIISGRDSQGTMDFLGATVNNGYGGGDRRIPDVGQPAYLNQGSMGLLKNLCL